MSPLGVVLVTPGFDDLPQFCHRDEPMLVQGLVAELTVEALDVGIFVRLAWQDRRQLHGMLVRPGIEHLALELRAVIDGDRLRQAAGLGKTRVRHLHAGSGDGRVDSIARTLACSHRRCSGIAGVVRLQDHRSRLVIEEWRPEYNEERPKKSRGGLTPSQYGKQLTKKVFTIPA
jgi:hypothetical protein